MFLTQRSTNPKRRPARSGTEDKAPKLDDLIRDQDWASVRTAIDTYKRAQRAAKKTINLATGNSSLLSLAVSLDVPAEVVSSLIHMEPSAVGGPRDHLGRIPIHVACSNGASAEVLNLLLEADPSSALQRDRDGRVPLHYAAEYAVGSYGELLGSLTVLCAAEPTAVFARDAWGKTPQEVATEMEVAAEMDGNLEMVMAARAVCQILRQVTSSVNLRRESERKDAKVTDGLEDATEEQKSESFLAKLSERQEGHMQKWCLFRRK